MFSLFMKPSIREGAMNIFAAFKDAGIDLNSKVSQPYYNKHTVSRV